MTVFQQFRRRLWIRTLVIECLLCLGVLLWRHEVLTSLLGGIAAGNFFLWSQMWSAERPQRGTQFVFSLTRVVVFAYLIVLLGQLKISQTLVVICGFLSYKVGLWMEYLLQAFPGRRKNKMQALSPVCPAPTEAPKP